jgi:hypothetical protein
MADLIIVEYPDGLPMPGISNPPTQIPHWNRDISNFLIIMISFATAYLHVNGAFLLFYPDGSNVRRKALATLRITISRLRMSGPSSITCTLQTW